MFIPLYYEFDADSPCSIRDTFFAFFFLFLPRVRIFALFCLFTLHARFPLLFCITNPAL